MSAGGSADTWEGFRRFRRFLRQEGGYLTGPITKVRGGDLDEVKIGRAFFELALAGCADTRRDLI